MVPRPRRQSGPIASGVIVCNLSRSYGKQYVRSLNLKDEMVIGTFEDATALRVEELLPLADGKEYASVGPGFDCEDVFDEKKAFSSVLIEQREWKSTNDGRSVLSAVGSSGMRIHPGRNGF